MRKVLLGSALSLLCLNPFPAQGKQVINSNLPGFDKALQLTGVKLALDCRTKLDRLKPEEIANVIAAMKLNSADIEDPLVLLLARKTNHTISSDCRTLDEIELSRVAMNVATNYDLRFKSGAYQDEKISEEHFMTASGIVAGHQCRKRKGLYSTSAEASERLANAFKVTNLPPRLALNMQVNYAGLKLSRMLDPTCTNFIDPEKAADILIMHFEELQGQ